ncbi:MAG: hypothetical protein JXB25_02320 [Deltaproteobacteria bacterium]|nr:hypothetical protein [Deltaproteobacteria bacterium]
MEGFNLAVEFLHPVLQKFDVFAVFEIFIPNFGQGRLLPGKFFFQPFQLVEQTRGGDVLQAVFSRHFQGRVFFAQERNHFPQGDPTVLARDQNTGVPPPLKRKNRLGRKIVNPPTGIGGHLFEKGFQLSPLPFKVVHPLQKLAFFSCNFSNIQTKKEFKG